jgi:hypothetical protein
MTWLEVSGCVVAILLVAGISIVVVSAIRDAIEAGDD